MADSERPTVGVVKESVPGEHRVALVPKAVEKLCRRGQRVVVESGAGAGARFADELFEGAGATIADPWGARIVLKVAPPSTEEIRRLRAGALLIGFLDPLSNPGRLAELSAAGVTALAVESIPRISRAQGMDALSSQSSVAGYKAVLLAAQRLPRFFPMMTTAAGTVPPANVLVLGAGVAGLQALATARRLGARTTGYDVRPEVADQVRSVGAHWLDLGIEAIGSGGYARALTEAERAEQERKLTESIAQFDVVLTTALVPGRAAPILVNAEAIRGMSAGSVVVDLAGESGGNCELTEPGKDIAVGGVTICSPLNLAADMPTHASELYARNIGEFLELLIHDDGSLAVDSDDEIVAAARVTDGSTARRGHAG